MDSLMTGWLESITFPSILLGTVAKVTPKLLSTTAPRWASLAISLGSLPIVVPISSQLADYTMNWTIRPFIQKLGEKFSMSNPCVLSLCAFCSNCFYFLFIKKKWYNLYCFVVIFSSWAIFEKIFATRRKWYNAYGGFSCRNWWKFGEKF